MCSNLEANYVISFRYVAEPSWIHTWINPNCLLCSLYLTSRSQTFFFLFVLRRMDSVVFLNWDHWVPFCALHDLSSTRTERCFFWNAPTEKRVPVSSDERIDAYLKYIYTTNIMKLDQKKNIHLRSTQKAWSSPDRVACEFSKAQNVAWKRRHRL